MLQARNRPIKTGDAEACTDPSFPKFVPEARGSGIGSRLGSLVDRLHPEPYVTGHATSLGTLQ